ncbi:MAG TPA: hypothetical protein DEV93_10040 [Chloroflexi bacterium]|nr:hypothetical protein [Chloroflexota bacterium]
MTPDEIVGRVVEDPSNPNARKVDGAYLGNSSREGYWRLYLNSRFDLYLEFRKEDTLDAQRQSTGRITVWVKPGTRVQTTRTSSIPVEMLQGPIQSSLVGRAVGPGLRSTLMLADAGCTVGPECGGTPACGTFVATCSGCG